MVLLDLFSGIGGFHLGLKMAGFEFKKVFYSEIDDYASRVYTRRFPDAVPLGDITKVTGEEIVAKSPSQGLERDSGGIPEGQRPARASCILTGGFPCQDLSVAGKQAGIKGARSGLFDEIIRIARVVRPGILFLENVPNLLSGEDGAWMRHVLGSITEIGYDCWWDVVSASSIGANHRRARIWIVAFPKGVRKGNRNVWRNRKPTDSNKIEKQRENYGNRTKIYAGRKWWDVEPNMGRVAHGVPKRVDRLKCLGNAVVPQCVAYVAEMVIKPILKAGAG